MNHLPCKSGSVRPANSRGRMVRAAAALLGILVAGAVLPGVIAARATEADGQARQETPAALEAKRERNQRALRDIAGQADVSNQALAALENDLQALRNDQFSLQEALDRSARRRAELDLKIAHGEESLVGLNERQNAIRLSLVARRALLTEVLAALQRIGRNPPPALLIEPEDALSSVRSAILLGAVVPGIRAETEALIADLDELAALRRSIAVERKELERALADNEAEEKRLSALVVEKLALQDESERRLDIERRRSAGLAEKSAELETLIARLETEIAVQRKAAEETRRAEEERRQRITLQLERARELAANGLPDKNRIAPAYAFSALQGTLARPVNGETMRYFGSEDGAGHALAGEVLVADADAKVRAPADGWVVYAGPFRSYGHVVILDTGEQYHVVLAGMDRLDVAAGQFVLAGEPVAAMGKTRLAGAAALALVSDRPALYIEIRKGGKPVDPRSWWRDKTSSGRVSNDT